MARDNDDVAYCMLHVARVCDTLPQTMCGDSRVLPHPWNSLNFLGCWVGIMAISDKRYAISHPLALRLSCLHLGTWRWRRSCRRGFLHTDNWLLSLRQLYWTKNPQITIWPVNASLDNPIIRSVGGCPFVPKSTLTVPQNCRLMSHASRFQVLWPIVLSRGHCFSNKLIQQKLDKTEHLAASYWQNSLRSWLID